MRVVSRQTLIPHMTATLSAEFADFDVFFENGPAVDFESQVKPFVMLEISTSASVQATIEAKPMVRYLADVIIAGFVRRGEGTARLDELLDRISKDLRTRYLGELLMLTPKDYRPRELKGWYGKAVRVPFTYDDLA